MSWYNEYAAVVSSYKTQQQQKIKSLHFADRLTNIQLLPYKIDYHVIYSDGGPGQA